MPGQSLLDKYAPLLALFCFVPLIGCGSAQSVQAAAAGPQGPAGPAGLIYDNVYNPLTPYVPTDVVYYQGSSFVAMVANTGVAPLGNVASSTDWGHLADRGADGAAGIKGDKGEAGQSIQGPAGPAGIQGLPGMQGPAGIQGLTGMQGPAGTQGLIGMQGPLGPQGPAGPQGATGVAGTSGPTGSQGATGPQGPAATFTTAQLSPFNKAAFGVFGDSYSDSGIWQPSVAAYHGMTQVFQDAIPGRGVQSILQCYGGIASPTAVNSGTCGHYNTGAVGNTLTQDLAGLDLLLIEVGVNDVYGEALGTISDTDTTASFHGYIKRALGTLEAANPTMRIVWITPVQVGISNRVSLVAGLRQAILDECALYSVPVIDEYARSGINAANWSVFLNPDLLHLSFDGLTKAYIPTINLGLNQTAPMRY